MSKAIPGNNRMSRLFHLLQLSMASVGGLGPCLHEPEAEMIMKDTFAYFSNFGPVVKIAAPGLDILSTVNGTDYDIESGSSMARSQLRSVTI